jgi:DNA-binding XRE family transcriptional regulator
MSSRRFAVRNRFSILLAEKGVREGRAITLQEVAKDIGANPNTLTRWNRPAANSLIDIEIAFALCDYFGCTLDDLFERVLLSA